MTKGLRIYYYAVFGAFGGLLGWFAYQMTLTANSQLLVGCIAGLCVGGCVGATDALLSARWRRAIASAFKAGVLCVVAGGLGLWIGDKINQSAGNVLTQCLGWMIFGSAIGAAGTFQGGSRATKGLIGGAIGGFLGGFANNHLNDPEHPSVLAAAVGLTVCGGSIGAFSSLIATFLMGAWVEVMDGKMKGRVYDLSKYIYSLKKNPIPAVIGSDEFKAEIYIMGDPEVAPRHASVRREEQQHVLKDLGGTTGTFVNGGRVEEHSLRDGDVIRVGKTTLLYREKRAEVPKA